MPDNIIQVGIQTTGAEQAQSAANQAAQGIQNVGNAASESASQTQNFGAATGEATSLLDRLILMAKEAGQALLGMGTRTNVRDRLFLFHRTSMVIRTFFPRRDSKV